MPESRLQHEAIRFLEQRGAYVVNTWGTPLAHSGVPDLLVCWKGQFIGIELKFGSGRTFAAQAFHLRKIQKAQGRTVIAYSLDDMEQIFNEQ